MRTTDFDAQWDHLMALCEREKEYRSAATHPKLLRLVSKEIDHIAAAMGFSDRQIERREFRAERKGWRITRIIRE